MLPASCLDAYFEHFKSESSCKVTQKNTVIGLKACTFECAKRLFRCGKSKKMRKTRFANKCEPFDQFLHLDSGFFNVTKALLEAVAGRPLRAVSTPPARIFAFLFLGLLPDEVQSDSL